ncbi:MAG: Nre family DNA repair protein [Thermoplasmatota archaeon]
MPDPQPILPGLARPSAGPVDASTACHRCGRTLRELRREVSIDAMRGSAPLCAVEGCPLVARLSGLRALSSIHGKILEGPAPSLFVGRHGYPTVLTGPLVPPSGSLDPLVTGPPSTWLESDIATLLSVRSVLLRTRAPVHVDVRGGPAGDPTRLLESARATALSTRPVETEVTLAKEIRAAEPRLDSFAAPMGPGVDVAKARVIGSPAVPRRVDAVVSDTDAPANVAVGELAEAGIAGEQIERLLSAGLLGLETRRKLVPTRWAITATDDMLGKRLLPKVRTAPELGEVEVYRSARFGNNFHIILIPGSWSYEMMEAWKSGEAWQMGRDSEGFHDRTQYVEEVAGAYYAARLAVAEHLTGRNRQAAALVLREITEDYWAPLGVWLIRETVRLALRGPPTPFPSLDEALRTTAASMEFRDWLRASHLLRERKHQRRLTDF